MRFCRLGRPDGDVFEQTGAARNRHQNHHAGEESERIPVNPSDRLGLIKYAHHNHEAGTKEGCDRPIDPVGDDDGVRDREKTRRHPNRAQSEIDVRRLGSAHHKPCLSEVRSVAYARLSQPGIGNTGAAAAFAAGSTTVGLPLRFCTAAERRSTFWPFSLNLMAPPTMTRSVMLVALSASTSASGFVEPARFAASAQMSTASKEKPMLRSKDSSG